MIGVAKVRAVACAAPFTLSAFAQADMVAPVV